MRLKFKWILTLLVALSMQFSFAQEKTVSGVVSDATGVIPGANVIVKGTKRSAQTDFDGKYSIKVSAGEVLDFSFLGLNSSFVKVGASNVVNVMLTAGSQNLEEVVVVAYGKVKKGSMVGAVTQIKGEALAGRAMTNVLSAVEGAAPGIRVGSGSGQPGAGISMQIRGASSINGSNEPLYIVDGVPFEGGLSNLNQNDVETISVLKDASSTSLYGSKASNGVVIITTKSGKSEKDTFTVNYSEGVSQRALREYERIDAYGYMPLMWETNRNAQISAGKTLAEANALASANVPGLVLPTGARSPFNMPITQVLDANGKMKPDALLTMAADDLDWAKAITRVGVRRSFDVSSQGKTKNGDYYISLGNLSEKGFIHNSSFNRTNARVTVNSKVADWFKTGLNLSGSLSKSNLGQDGTGINNPFAAIRSMGPLNSLYKYDAAGNYLLTATGERVYSSDRASGAINGRNPIYEALNNVNEDNSISVSARAYSEISFLNDFKFKATGSIDRVQSNSLTVWNTVIGDGSPDGLISKDNRINTSVTLNQILTYDKKVNDFNVSALLGHESFSYERKTDEGTKRKESIKDVHEYSNYVNVTNLQSATRDYATESYFSRLNVDYNEKYLASASFRRDGSSKFHPDGRWGNFWSVGTGWNVKKESFLEGMDWLNDLKLRGSIGQVGNDFHTNHIALDFLAYMPTYAIGENNDTQIGIKGISLGSPDLRWEKNTQTDIALDFAVFKNRISGSVEFYYRITDDLIFDVPLPATSGFSFQKQNIGTMFNRGVELNLNFQVLRDTNFKWDVNVNATTIDNEITYLPQDEIITGTKKLKAGHSMYDYWLRSWYGVNPNNGDALYKLDSAMDTPANAAKVFVINGERVTNDQNLALFEYQGKATPDLSGSFSNTFKYNGISLNILCTYGIGGKTYDSQYAGLMQQGSSNGSAFHKEILNRWQNPGDVTDVPRLDSSKQAIFNAASSRWLVDASYVTIRQIGLSYDLPKSLLNKVKISNMRLTANAENLWSFTKRIGMDPAQSFSGVTSNRFAPSRIFSAGLSFNF
jgi:TonB-linked SusC/RagA family outer membrane protein